MEQAPTTLLKKYPTHVPRYTSYPTAPHFRPLAPEQHAEWLQNVPKEASVSLYLHIPYCKKLCWFCGCHTKVAQQYTPVQSFLSELENEISLISSLLGRRQPVSHVHLGGGSPTILQSKDFSTLMDTLQAHFLIEPDAEIAIEIDPRTASEAKIARYAQYKVNRVSLGVQDFDPAVQAAINRIQPFACVYEVTELCREYGIDNICLDLVYGLPKQTLKSFADTLEQAVLLTPNRIALFGYAHVPWMKKGMHLIDPADLPSEFLRYDMFKHASDYLSDNGYIPIGLDHFVKPGDGMDLALQTYTLKRNFQGYTTDRSDILIGLGPSAISSFPQGYVQNNPTIDCYHQQIASGALASLRGYALSADDRVRRDIIEQLMCYYAADVADICKLHSLPFAMFAPVFRDLKPMVDDRLVEIDHSLIRIHKTVPQAVRLVCAAFDAYFSGHANQHAQVA